MKERLANIGRVAAATGLFLTTAFGVDASPVFAGGGCPNIPPKPEDVGCPNPVDHPYVTNRFAIDWVKDNEFRVESRTRFLGFLWETGDGTKEGLVQLARLCGPLGDIQDRSQLFQDIARARTALNPKPGCLISEGIPNIGGGGG